MKRLKDITPYPCLVSVRVKDSSDKSIVGWTKTFYDNSEDDFILVVNANTDPVEIPYDNHITQVCRMGLRSTVITMREEGRYWVDFVVSVD